MRNRAKCKLCKEIIESFHRHDFVTCKCGEISVDGGLDQFKCGAKDWNNFRRVDDLGNEIIVTVKHEPETIEVKSSQPRLTKKEQIEMFDEMLKNMENLPQNAMLAPITHYDLYSFMLIISSILKSDSKD